MLNKRLSIVTLLLLLTVTFVACGSQPNAAAPTAGSTGAANSASNAAKTVHIGYQKFGTLTILKAQGNLEKRLQSDGVSVDWVEFPSGPALLEALNTNTIDFGTTGEAPPIFAQAANPDLLYVASEPGNPDQEAFLVPENSPIKSVAELKGKKVALNKGSNVHYLLVKALEEAGLQYTDISVVFLPPADARAAFQGGSVDAWVIWEPFLSVAVKELNARVLRDGSNLVSNRAFYLARRAFVNNNPTLLKAVLEEIASSDNWAKANPAAVGELISKVQGLDAGVLEAISRATYYGVEPISDQIVTDQQKIADVFFGLGLIPKAIAVTDAAWRETKAS